MLMMMEFQTVLKGKARQCVQNASKDMVSMEMHANNVLEESTVMEQHHAIRSVIVQKLKITLIRSAKHVIQDIS